MSLGKLIYTPEEVSEALGGSPSAKKLKAWAGERKIASTGGYVDGMKFPISFTKEQVDTLLKQFERGKETKPPARVEASPEVDEISAKKLISSVYTD